MDLKQAVKTIMAMDMCNAAGTTFCPLNCGGCAFSVTEEDAEQAMEVIKKTINDYQGKHGR